MYEARGFAEAKQKAGGNRFDDQSHWSKNQKHGRCLDIKRLKASKNVGICCGSVRLCETPDVIQMRRMSGLPRQWKTTSSDTEGARLVRSTLPAGSHGRLAGQRGSVQMDGKPISGQVPSMPASSTSVKSNAGRFEEFGLFFGSGSPLMQHPIHSVQVSTGARLDHIRTGAFTGNESAAAEVAFQIDFA